MAQKDNRLRVVTSALVGLFNLDPNQYSPSPLHDCTRIFRESNCYVDIWIELLHASGIDPASGLAFTCAVDFEGDQWTFFKPPPQDLESLYGIDVHEMQFYRPPTAHVLEQLRAGRTILLEVDSFYLPDTAATSYQRAHVKSSIAVEAIDVEAETLRYFHGTGYHELANADFRGVFRLGRKFCDDVLPPYVELVRFDTKSCLWGEALREAARHSLHKHLQRRPKRNPWLTFGSRLVADLPALLMGDQEAFHTYAFATVRQCGAAFELCGNFIDWLVSPGAVTARKHADAASCAFMRQAQGAKTLLFQLARRRPFDPLPQIDQLARDWEMAQAGLEEVCHLPLSASS